MDGGGPVSWDTVAVLTLVLDAGVPQGQEPLPLHRGAGGHLPQVLKYQLLLPTVKYNVLMAVKVVVDVGVKYLYLLVAVIVKGIKYTVTKLTV